MAVTEYFRAADAAVYAFNHAAELHKLDKRAQLLAAKLLLKAVQELIERLGAEV